MSEILSVSAAMAAPPVSSDDAWTILVVDPEAQGRAFTATALNGFLFEGKPVRLVEAGSPDEAVEFLGADADVAIMTVALHKGDQAGLALVARVRDELKRDDVRIMVSTDRDAAIDARALVSDHDVSDCQVREDMTPDRLVMSVVIALRSYGEILQLRNDRADMQKLVDLGIALSTEKNHSRLMEMILTAAKGYSNADGGTLYTVTADGKGLRFEIMLNDTLGTHMGGASGTKIPFPPVPMFLPDGAPNLNNVSTQVAHSGRTVNIEDAYTVTEFDFSGTKRFDAGNNYRSQSFLTVPLKNHENDVIGVLQLINARDKKGKVISFGPQVQPMIEAMASQAAVASDNQALLEAQKQLFASFIDVIAGAIDSKSPYTGGHCNRVPLLTELLVKAACDETEGPFADFNLSDEEWYELKIAAGLHDCGKVTTPEYVVDKATKLETIYNRIHEIRTRFEVVKRDAEIAYLKAVLAGGDEAALKADVDARLKQIDEDFAFVAESNVGGEFMAPEKVERLKKIGETQWLRTLDDSLGLSLAETRRLPQERAAPPVWERLLDDKPDHLVPHDQEILSLKDPRFVIKVPEYKFNLGEIYNLSIPRGTLTNEERFHINDHIVQTIKMLEALPFPKNLRRVPEIAGGHHEKMDGGGYPMGLKRDEMSIPARVMAIADIFEALTAADRPYKPPKTLSDSIKIMSFMKKDAHVDPDLFDLFLKSGIYRTYAEQLMRPEQIDDVDISKYLSAPQQAGAAAH